MGAGTVIGSLIAVLGLDDQMTDKLKNAEANATSSGRRIGAALGRGALVVGGAMLAIGVAAVDAASEWEKAWLGVTAELDGTPEELQAVEDGLRELATSEVVGTMENAAIQLAAIAEAAAAAGVAAPDMVKFVETMALLQMTTDIGGEKAVEMVTQYMRLSDLDPNDVDNFANAIAVLGDESGTSASTVLDLANQMTTLGDRLGMSDADLVGFSGWLASLGIEGRKARSSLSELLDGITAAVNEGGPKLTTFADVSGQSAADFAAAWETDPMAALQTFLGALGELDATEQVAVLEDLELNSAQMTDSILKMAGAEGELTNVLGVANEAWAANNAMLEEASGPAGGLEATIQRLKNQWNELLLVIGEPLLGAVADAIGKVSELASKFTDAVKKGDELGAIEIAFNGIYGAISDVITNLADFVGGAVADLLGVNWPGAQAGVAAFFGAMSMAVDVVRIKLQGLISAIQTAFDNLGKLLNAQGTADFVVEDYNTNNPDTYVPSTMPDFADAAGGPVFRNDGIHLVGERGPELFIPGADGTIIPNHALGGAQVVIQAVYVQDSDPQRWLDRLNDAARMRGATTPMGVW